MRLGPVAALLTLACGSAVEERPAGSAGPAADERPYTVLESEPDPEVITDAGWRERIVASGYPWRVRHTATGMEMLLVPTGSFGRGADDDDPEATADERPQHVVEVRAPFYLGRYEVGQAEWRRVMGDSPSFFEAQTGAGPQPVEQVSCFQAEAFAQLAGLALPTESQWEYACRAGEPGPRYGALEEVAWHGGRRGGNAGRRPHAAGRLAANALGFHDMLGNVWEWTSSGFMDDEYGIPSAPIDARARIRGAPTVVMRGGSWYDPPKRARASARYAVERDFAAGHVGLRAMLPLD